MPCADRDDGGSGEFLNDFVDDLLRRATAAVGRVADDQVVVAFGPLALQVEAHGVAIGRVAIDAIRHAEVNALTRVDLKVLLIDGKETGFEFPAIDSFPAARSTGPAPEQDSALQRLTLALNEEWKTWCIIDGRKRLALIWTADAASIPEWVIYDQIRNVLHWLSHRRPLGLVHAAALQLGAAGCLIAGKSGSGKSTITAAAVCDGFATAGDDFVMIETGGPLPRVHAIFDTVKLDDKSMQGLPEYFHASENPLRRSEDKAIVHLFEVAPGRIATGFPLQAILHSRITGERESGILRSSPADAFKALAPSSVVLLRGQEKEVVANAMKLVTTIPTFAFGIGTDRAEAMKVLTGFMQDLAR